MKSFLIRMSVAFTSEKGLAFNLYDKRYTIAIQKDFWYCQLTR